MEKKDTLMDDRDTPSIYVGETSRIIKERALEHWKDYQSGEPDSHIRKHWTLHHDGIGEPQFVFKVVRQFRDALSRQVAEAIRIMLRQNTINSKNGYNRCSITRVVMDNQEHSEGESRGEDDSLKNASIQRLNERRFSKDRQYRANFKLTGMAGRPAEKRKEVTKETFVTGQRKKKTKFEKISLDWGTGTDEEDQRALERKLETREFLEEQPIYMGESSTKLRQTAIKFKVWTEEELWVRRAVLWEVVDSVIEIHETSKTTVNDMVAKVVAMQEEAKGNKETELKRAEQRLRAKNKSQASFNK